MQRTEPSPARGMWQGSPVLDWIIAFLAVGALGATVLADLPIHASTFAASDLKTLYASAWCFRHGLDAYSFDSLGRVFAGGGIPLPSRWYGHAAVYPPPTLALLAPLTLFPMATACWVEIAGSIALMAVAVGALLRYGATEFRLPLPWRLAVAGACAAGPLFAFALSVGNLSVAASALAILGVLWRRHGPVPWPGLLLGIAALAKPHLALWVVVALLALPERRGRLVAGVALLWALVLGAGLAVALGGARLPAQMRAFSIMVSAETARGGSMFPGSHEALPVMAQITSLPSLLGFWTRAPIARGIIAALLLSSLILLFRLTSRMRGEKAATLAVAAWSALGMLMTYHRAHDAVLLLVLTPWLADRLRRRPADLRLWALLALYAALSFGPAPAGGSLGQYPRTPVGFLRARQAALAALPFFGVLLLLIREEAGTEAGRQPRPARTVVAGGLKVRKQLGA